MTLLKSYDKKGAQFGAMWGHEPRNGGSEACLTTSRTFARDMRSQMMYGAGNMCWRMQVWMGGSHYSRAAGHLLPSITVSGQRDAGVVWREMHSLPLYRKCVGVKPPERKFKCWGFIWHVSSEQVFTEVCEKYYRRRIALISYPLHL